MSLKRKTNNLLFPFAVLVVVLGQQAFFSVCFMAEAAIPSLNSTGKYSIFLAVASLFAFGYFFFRLFAKKLSLPSAAWIALFLLVVLLGSMLMNRSLYVGVWDFFLYFLMISMPGLLLGLTFEEKNGLGRLADMSKVADWLIILLTAGVFVYEFMNYGMGFSNRALSGVTYQQVSYMGALAFGLNCASLLQGKKNKLRIFKGPLYTGIQLFMLVIQLGCVVVSGGRGGFALVCVYGVLSMIHLMRQSGTRVSRLLFIPMALLAIGLMHGFGLIDLSSLADTRGFERIFTFKDNRSEVMVPAISLISEHFLFGYGVGGYIPYLGNYPHNIFLEVLLNWGVVGLCLVLVVMFSVLGRLRKLFKKCPLASTMLIFMAVSPVVFLMFSSSFMANATLWFFVGLAYSPLCECVILRSREGRTASFGRLSKEASDAEG